MDVHSITNRLQIYGDEIQALNERLRQIHTIVFGGARTSARPLDAPPIKTEAPAPTSTISEYNFTDAFDYQDHRITYYLDYAREMVSSLEAFTQPQEGRDTAIRGVSANQTYDSTMKGGAGSPERTFRTR